MLLTTISEDHIVFTGTMSPTPEVVQIHQTCSPTNDDGNYFDHIHTMAYLKHVLINNNMIGEDEGVILEEDSEDEEGYVFTGTGDFLMFHIITCKYYAYF
jgi:hypothetical protein